MTLSFLKVPAARIPSRVVDTTAFSLLGLEERALRKVHDSIGEDTLKKKEPESPKERLYTYKLYFNTLILKHYTQLLF